MRFSYQVANPRSGGESYLLRFEGALDGQTACVLVDSGQGVDLDSLLGDDEYLTAVLLTHAHLDHYVSLSKTLRHGAPVYASQPTANVLEHVLTEGEKNYDIGDSDDVLDALTPVTEWTSLLAEVDVRAVPAGHVPGGAGFVFRFRDDEEYNHVFVTGDFTTRTAGGYPGLATTFPADVDALITNGTTRNGVERTLTDATSTALRRAEEGSTVLLTASGLTGVSMAYRLGHLSDQLDCSVPITLVGQAAKLYEDLDYDVPNVETVPVFDGVSELLARGRITISGPEIPVEGSSRTLFSAIEDDAAATLVQLTGGATNPVESASCTVYDFELVNHPTLDTVDSVVSALDPIQIVVGHGTRRQLNQYRGRYDDGFVWLGATDDENVLYDDGRWLAPPWLDEAAADAIRRQDWRQNGVRTGTGEVEGWDDVPPVERDDSSSLDLSTEGLLLDELESQFRSPSMPDVNTRDGTDDEAVTNDGARADASTTERDDSREETATKQFDGDFQAELRSRLETIENAVSAPESRIRARVVDAGEDVTLLRVVEGDPEFEHGEELGLILSDSD